ncbi:hypothetical protein DFH27DRAFT_611119 [Peziza echinospora]|nr:hypothetical protein DFH27DRAFT_611119 [Peziza echinospora]
MAPPATTTQQPSSPRPASIDHLGALVSQYSQTGYAAIRKQSGTQYPDGAYSGSGSSSTSSTSSGNSGTNVGSSGLGNGHNNNHNNNTDDDDAEDALEYEESQFAADMSALSSGLPRMGGLTPASAAGYTAMSAVDRMIRDGAILAKRNIPNDLPAQRTVITALEALRAKKIDPATGSPYISLLAWAKAQKRDVFEIVGGIEGEEVVRYLADMEEGFKAWVAVEEKKILDKRSGKGSCTSDVLLARKYSVNEEQEFVRDLSMSKLELN